ncbi:MAG: FAD-binding protein [Chloroflexota bacterium]|nr:FAD-binding protein [Chloroflexota bacterium]
MELDRLGQVHHCDVLIVGGGNAGMNAAISAREQGADVLVMEKADPARSGSIGGGVDHFMSYLDTGPEWDTREGFLAYAGKVARGAVDLRVQDAVFCRGGRDEMIDRFARVGSPLQQEDGTFYRTQSYGMPGPYWINFNGKNLKFNLWKDAVRKGARMLPRVVATGLVESGGRVAGCVGFHIRSGEFHIALARSIVMATGNTNRIYQNPTPYRFNTWQCPADTGAAQAMAFEAGAALANMEYMRWTVVPRGFSAAGLNALTGMGGKLVNAAGEEIMSRYHPLGDKAPRYVLVEAVYGETVAGRGPVYIDCRHLPPEGLTHLRHLLGWDKDTLPDFMEQQGIDLTRDPLEVWFSEGMQSGPAEVCASGIKIDELCAGSLPGLFAAGDCADQTRCVHLCAAGGSRAGRYAAEAAAGASIPAVDPLEVAGLKQAAFAPLRRESTGLSYVEVEDAIARLMWQNVGPVRTEEGLLQARRELAEMEDKVQAIAASDLHELMRAHEVRTMWTVSRLTTEASIPRKETRFGPFFKRADYPDTDDRFCGQMVVRRDGEAIAVQFQPLSYEVPA